MSDIALFDLDVEAEVWRPIFHRHGLDLLDLIAGPICRDCGRTKFTWEKGCGGARPGIGSFELCDDCAALDGRGQRGDGHDEVSRWGIRTTDEEAAELVEVQRRRRVKWLKASRVLAVQP